MSSAPIDARRRGLLQQYVPLDLSTHWDVPQVVKAKSVRSLALGGTVDYVARGLTFEKPCGVIEIVGSRAGHCATTLLMVFSRHGGDGIPRFTLDRGEALGTMVLPIEAFAGFLQLVSSPTLHFRLGGTGEANAVASDVTMLQA